MGKVSRTWMQSVYLRRAAAPVDFSMEGIFRSLGIDRERPGSLLERLPFGLQDATAGSETELQAVVLGRREDVDLPLSVEASNYYANIVRRAASGDVTDRDVSELETFFRHNPDGVWENSWVRFPGGVLSPFARSVLEKDLLADKEDPSKGRRGDVHRFLSENGGQEALRVPVSYLIKLALADVMGSQPQLPGLIRQTGYRLLGHYLSDNSSPETTSFHVVPLRPETGMGRALAKETSKRLLLTHLLVMYANEKFRLRQSGQRAMVYLAPNPPERQRTLNSLVSDAFYRELFMSPCLAGWNRGEDKYGYMRLCHRVLSRSQLNTLGKLREAGILTNDLVVLPHSSNTCLANNGTHVSLGSLALTSRLRAGDAEFTPVQEKALGDLAIKVVEHFLPLFVGTYSGAPYRLGFADFHPEKVLGFLPHELDFTHLRMMWRRWKKKAHLKVLGRPMTPFGPRWLDEPLGRMLGLRGDFVPDFRLLDYLVALLGTETSSALDGRLGNVERLKKDLADLGVFDVRMALYLPYRLREFLSMGFSGFEGRHYSLFDSLEHDLGPAVNLQTLVTALAFKLMATGQVSHGLIPDSPQVESERRQIFFGTAIGLPTFYVHKDSSNLFLSYLLEDTQGVRSSRRYPGYLRVPNLEYRKALVRLLRREAGDLIDMMDLDETLRDLEARLEAFDLSAAGKLSRGILGGEHAKKPMQVPAREFNRTAEGYYRSELRRRHILEAMDFLAEDVARLPRLLTDRAPSHRSAVSFVLGRGDGTDFVRRVTEGLEGETLPLEVLVRLINLVLVTVYQDTRDVEATLCGAGSEDDNAAPVYRAGNG